MSLIIGLDHVNLLIDAGDDAILKARAFYQDLLGLEPLERPANTDSGRAGAWYQFGPQQLYLTTEDGASSVNKAFAQASGLQSREYRSDPREARESRREDNLGKSISRPRALLRARPMGQPASNSSSE